MANIINSLGQVKVGFRTQSPPAQSTLMSSIYSVYNADSQGLSSLKTSLYGVYNGESNTNDSFGTNNGTAQGGLTYGVGKVGTAFQFNGTNSYILLPTGSMRFTNSFSVSMWTYTTANQSGNKGLFSDYYWPSDLGYTIYMTSSNKVETYFLGNGNTTNAFTSNSTLSNNQWNHIVVLWDKSNTQWKVYINGVLDNTYTNANASVINYGGYGNQRTNIGAINSSPSGVADVFNGKIDAFNVWNKVLTQSEITELYNSGNGAQYITDNFYKPTTNDALNTYNGTAQGGLTYGVGKVGTSFDFNGTNAYVSLPNNSFNFTGDFSISFWTYLTNVSSSNLGLVTNFNSGAGNSGWTIGTITSGNLYFGTYNISNQENPTPITINTWNHVTCTFKKNNTKKIYINGVLVLTESSPLSPKYSPTHYPSIGASTYSPVLTQQYLPNGSKIDAINIWNKELSASEITELYNSGNGKQYPN